MEYRQKVLALLGDREPLSVMERLVPSLRSALQGLPPELLACPEAKGKWSVLQVVRHLADTEIVYGYRLRMVLTLDRPRFNRFDQESWTGRLQAADSDPEPSLQLLDALRRADLRLLHLLSPQDLQRSGIHSSRGEETVEQMIPLWAGHDLLHLAQIERIRRKVSI